ncbi:molybdopterin molybdotransferase MoeA [Leifsonia shinshuensis]|uniref:molybdopterin molybdotransferase MoeA n=1 Tax=Leifsonia shinshuensis TaxID=150026 RepID=UPI001F506E48|nr:molybdopterin molybdotransferase MoeA [Leifsonia shinshuensis]MCI0159001.1 molybdopterin molybdotransferase MoeA [Leifsonia shinshuensis]
MTARPSWLHARDIAAAAGASAALAPEYVPLDRAVGRRLADDLVTPIDLPHFASAAMDGWLVVGDGPWELVAVEAPAPGQARTIVTGAHVPAPTDGAHLAVLRSESGAVEGGVLRSTVADEPRPGHHIRLPATEAERGELLIASGTRLNPAHVALAAATGADELAVQAVPTVALVFTGDEVIESGLPAAGRVRDSFGVQFPALIGMLGGRVVGAARIPDHHDDTVAALRDARAEVIVTTGGTGGSSADHVRAALLELGARLLVDGVAMRPGGPTRIAELPDGRLVVALPGNPLAAMISAITLVEPLLAQLAGREPVAPRVVRGPAAEGRAGSTVLVPYSDVHGRAVVAAWRGAAMLRGLAGATGILVVPPEGLREGEDAESLPVPWLVLPVSAVEN